MGKDSGRVTRLSSSMEPEDGLPASRIDPARGEEWTRWLTEAAVRANDAWTRDRSVSISCTPNGFWIDGRQLVREHKAEVRAQQLRPFIQVARARCNILTEAVERVLHLLEYEAERARDSGRHPQGEDPKGLSGEAMPDRPNEDSASPNLHPRGSHDR